MSKNPAVFQWIEKQEPAMLDLLIQWAKINTYTFNCDGLTQFATQVEKAGQVFEEKIEILSLPTLQQINARGQVEVKALGRAIKFQKRPQASRQVLCVIHMDTVYPPDKPNPDVQQTDAVTLKGPGVADAKGGLVVMLKALEAFEQTPDKEKLGWTVFINPDEEIGSPGSQPLLAQLAMQAQVGLLFEPCLANGDLVGTRKGSGNFTLVIRGRSAHAGRDIHLGRNAIEMLSRAILKITEIKNQRPGLTVNIGMVEGGVALNVVPDVAIGRFNIRIDKQEDEAYVWVELKRILEECMKVEGIKAELHGGFFALPKILTAKVLPFYQALQACGQEMGMNFHWQPSGGVCDGNRLAACGLPNIDTLGVQGGELHSPDEYMLIPSLVQRTKLTTSLLLKLANDTSLLPG